MAVKRKVKLDPALWAEHAKKGKGYVSDSDRGFTMLGAVRELIPFMASMPLSPEQLKAWRKIVIGITEMSNLDTDDRKALDIQDLKARAYFSRRAKDQRLAIRWLSKRDSE